VARKSLRASLVKRVQVGVAREDRSIPIAPSCCHVPIPIVDSAEKVAGLACF
jgi:hypothetical protein